MKTFPPKKIFPIFIQHLWVCLIALLIIARPASAMIVQDQSYSDTSNTTASFSLADMTFGRAQVFTVGVAGILDAVVITAGSPGIAFSEMRILATSGGVPIGGSGGSTVIANSTSFTESGNDYTFDFSAAALAIDIGDQFAIEVFAPGGSSWIGHNPNTYAGGSSYFFNSPFGINNWSFDSSGYFFTTYVDVVAEPATWVLLCLGGGLLLFLGRSKMKWGRFLDRMNKICRIFKNGKSNCLPEDIRHFFGD